MPSAVPTSSTSPPASTPAARGSRRPSEPGSRSSMAPSRSGFSDAVMRIVPDIEREEFVNAGLILHSPERRYLVARTFLDEAALAALRPGCDTEAIRDQLRFVEAVAAGELDDGPLAA